MAQPGLERLVRDQEAEGSNPSIPIVLINRMRHTRVGWLAFFLFPLLLGAGDDVDPAIAALMQTINMSAIPQERPELSEWKIKRIRFTDEELLKRFMGADARKTQDSQDLRVYEDSNQRILQIFRDGSFTFTYPADPKEVANRKMSPQEARSVAEAFLEQHGGLPEGAYEFKSGSVSQNTSYGEAVIYYFTYSHHISGVVAEFDNISVSVGAGRVLEFAFGWSAVVESKDGLRSASKQVIPALDAVRRALAFQFERILGNKLYRPVKVEGASLIYSLKKPREYEVAVPAWKVSLSMESQVVTDPAVRGALPEKVRYVQHIRVNALTGDVIFQ